VHRIDPRSTACIGIEPVTPDMPSTGVSSTPIGAVDAPFGIVVSPTVTGSAVLPAPVKVSGMVPVLVPATGSPLTN
jgi:hypothetical protein